MPQAILHTERLRLVPLSHAHIEHQIELDADPEVMRYLGGPRTRAQVVDTAHRAALADARRADGLGYWAGFTGGHFTGYWILRPPGDTDEPAPPGQAELGYRLLRRHWRQGLGSEGSAELIRHGFQDLALDRICAMTSAANTASRATMAAVGLRHARDFDAEASWFPPGTDLRSVEYAITRTQWNADRAA
ncbi:GNAT family N-acetyltransferase [Streptomyces spectabilis]|uniref:N-acetyltransferase n=1 Tax=Streptomyces spectabilis TaxID=68270 RepID=A0A5P2X4L8_STRST|nr:GNAT family N-acetyltransferase [Streptomyces spectabilis]MBB5108006.1 RimJ/RimL family protein N-acetyltransferase [Streptomyces spectabilis]MCI3907892.1 GNAT family N-acetyltransferase [Streptomyces spectabilis]QEV57352.1 N-acetyltransferase [Streptomyces spectabilis]GGV53253.1 GNAT family acetyltransferase [Streptomyces spectabilis]